MSDTIYAVYATDTDRDCLLGYAIGDKEDINAYYQDRQGYGLRLETVNPIRITPGYAETINDLKTKKARLEAEIDAINKIIKLGI